MIELACKTFMPIQTLNLQRVNWTFSELTSLGTVLEDKTIKKDTSTFDIVQIEIFSELFKTL